MPVAGEREETVSTEGAAAEDRRASGAPALTEEEQGGEAVSTGGAAESAAKQDRQASDTLVLTEEEQGSEQMQHLASDNIAELQAAANKARYARTRLGVDLCKRKLKGALSGDLVLLPGTELCNGSIFLPIGAKMCFDGCDAHLSKLSICGTSSTDCAVEIRGASHVKMEDVWVDAGRRGAGNAAAVRVDGVGKGEGWQLSARNCHFHSSYGSGLVVQGGGTVKLEGTRCNRNGADNVQVGGGATAKVVESSLQESKGVGLFVRDQGSTATARACSISYSHLPNVCADKGGVAELEGCEIRGSPHGPKLSAKCRGSVIAASACMISGNYGTAVEAGSGGVRWRGCDFDNKKNHSSTKGFLPQQMGALPEGSTSAPLTQRSRFETSEERAYYNAVVDACKKYPHSQAACHKLASEYGGPSIPANLVPGGANLNGSLKGRSFSMACAVEGAEAGAQCLRACAAFRGVSLSPDDARDLAADAERHMVKLISAAISSNEERLAAFRSNPQQNFGSWEEKGMWSELRPVWKRFTHAMMDSRDRAATAAAGTTPLSTSHDTPQQQGAHCAGLRGGELHKKWEWFTQQMVGSRGQLVGAAEPTSGPSHDAATRCSGSSTAAAEPTTTPGPSCDTQQQQQQLEHSAPAAPPQQQQQHQQHVHSALAAQQQEQAAALRQKMGQQLVAQLKEQIAQHKQQIADLGQLVDKLQRALRRPQAPPGHPSSPSSSSTSAAASSSTSPIAAPPSPPAPSASAATPTTPGHPPSSTTPAAPPPESSASAATPTTPGHPPSSTAPAALTAASPPSAADPTTPGHPPSSTAPAATTAASPPSAADPTTPGHPPSSTSPAPPPPPESSASAATPTTPGHHPPSPTSPSSGPLHMQQHDAHSAQHMSLQSCASSSSSSNT